MFDNLQAIHGLPERGGLIIAVGERGTARHFEDGSWRLVPTHTHADLHGVLVLSTKEAYAVGTKGTLLRWDGVAWRHLQVDTEADLYTVGGAFPHIWLGGGGVLFHWTAPDKAPELCLESNDWMRVVWAPPGEPHRPFLLTNAALFRFNVETGMDPVDLAVPAPRGVFDPDSPSHGGARDAELYAMAANGPDDIWVTGNGSAYHWNGQVWTTRMVGAEAIFGVAFARPGEAVSVTGCGRILYWPSDDWRERKAVKRAWLSSVFCQDGVAYVVGQHGSLFSVRVAESEFQELSEYFDPVMGGWMPVWRPERSHSSVYDPNFNRAIRTVINIERRPPPPARSFTPIPIVGAATD